MDQNARCQGEHSEHPKTTLTIYRYIQICTVIDNNKLVIIPTKLPQIGFHPPPCDSDPTVYSAGQPATTVTTTATRITTAAAITTGTSLGPTVLTTTHCTAYGLSRRWHTQFALVPSLYLSLYHLPSRPFPVIRVHFIKEKEGKRERRKGTKWRKIVAWKSSLRSNTRTYFQKTTDCPPVDS